MPQYKFRAKHLFATYPQVGPDVSKEDALAAIINRYDVEWALVAHELHADGEPHLHCVVRFKDYFQTHDPHEFDHVAGKHGNYQSPRGLKAVLTYCYKGGDVVSHGDVPSPESSSATSSRVSLSVLVAKAIRSGKSLSDIRDSDEMCGFYLTHKKHCQSLATEIMTESYKKTLKSFPGISVSLDAAPCEVRLNKWLSDNLQTDRSFKQKQLFLYGPPGIGKSSLALKLSEYFLTYYPPMDEEFYDGYHDGCDLIIFDEFKAQKRITFLNQFLQGAPMTLRIKGAQVMKRKNHPVMIFSNFSLEQCYTHAPQVAIDSLKERLEVIEWDVPTHIRCHLDGEELQTQSLWTDEENFYGAQAPE